MKTSRTIYNDALPGPGQYNVRKDFGNDAPKFSLYGRTGFGKKQSTPGPGQYNPKESLT